MLLTLFPLFTANLNAESTTTEPFVTTDLSSVTSPSASTTTPDNSSTPEAENTPSSTMNIQTPFVTTPAAMIPDESTAADGTEEA